MGYAWRFSLRIARVCLLHNTPLNIQSTNHLYGSSKLGSLIRLISQGSKISKLLEEQ